jgi:UDP-N-acetylglucosamine--N-acetylmuramyl-(pentapeptide) pyrophosphoryl-undecaprenol N-acetylglucosamine transferase
MTTLLVSSVGGHLADLHHLLPRLQGIEQERVWVTFDTPQSRSLLADEEVVYVDYTAPRDVKNVLRHSLLARRLFKGSHRFSAVVSTGSGIALSFLPLARARGVRCHYIECSACTSGPSVTGKLLRLIPDISLYSQYEDWARRPWRYAGSVLDAFAPGPTSAAPRQIRRVVVTVGTMQDYPFRRLIERVIDVLPPGVDVLWQTGCTDVSDLPIRTRAQVAAHELQEKIRAADVVIAHAGCGSSVSALQAGKMPILVARRRAHGENVDDHQLMIAGELAERGLAIARDVEQLSAEDLQLAARGSVRADRAPAPFPLAV